nr:putative zinc finger, CCHC-type [Tanacetum cinerariifolium]
MAKPENAESTVQFDAEEYEEHQKNPNQKTPTEFSKSNINQYFTFDDVPSSKWRERSIEMLTWCAAELQYYTIDVVIKRFLTRLQERLRDWYHNDVNIKLVFLNSFPESLGNEAYQALEARNVTISQITIGELYQLILNTLAKLYNQKKFLAEFERTKKRLGTTCADKYLQIKCKDKSSCDCTHTKKKFHTKRYSSLSSKPRFSQRSNKKWKFIRKKKQRGRTSDSKPVDFSDLESLYSLDDEPSDSVLCTIACSDFSSDDDSDTDSLESDSDFGLHMINPIPHVLPIQEDPPFPLAKIHLLTDAYDKPILVIAFFDTGSSVSILNHNILPDHYWKPHHQNLMAANGGKFCH